MCGSIVHIKIYNIPLKYRYKENLSEFSFHAKFELQSKATICYFLVDCRWGGEGRSDFREHLNGQTNV